MENPIRPEDSGSLESFSDEPIKLRFHHMATLFNSYDTHTTHERFSRKPIEDRIDFDQIYLHPELVERLLQTGREMSQKNLKRHLRGRVAKYDIYDDPKEAKEMAQDYTGKGGKNIQEYLNEFIDAKRELLLGDPETRIDFTWGPDKICFACQSTEPGQPGKHCVIPVGMDNNEGDCYRVVEYMSGLPEADGKISEIMEETGKHSFTTTLGFLRSSIAMEAMGEKYRELTKARFIPPTP